MQDQIHFPPVFTEPSLYKNQYKPDFNQKIAFYLLLYHMTYPSLTCLVILLTTTESELVHILVQKTIGLVKDNKSAADLFASWALWSWRQVLKKACFRALYVLLHTLIMNAMDYQKLLGYANE